MISHGSNRIDAVGHRKVPPRHWRRPKPVRLRDRRDGEVLSCSHNTVVLTTDITAHAEVNAIREACREIGDIFLDGAIVATTCEPCPMCMSALHWARVETVYYGATIADADYAGFNELQLPAAELLASAAAS